MEKDPTSYGWITYAWVIGLSAIGGFVGFMRKLQLGHARAFNIVEFLGELVTSAFAGIITFWLCESANINPLVSAALVGISGHAGSRAIFAIESWAQKKFPG